MGFLDKLKGTAKQAVNPVGQAGERDKIMRLNKVGVQTTATVDTMKEVGTQFGGGHRIEFALTVHPQSGADYKAHVSQSLHDVTLQGVSEGGEILVKVDPQDPQALLVSGASELSDRRRTTAKASRREREPWAAGTGSPRSGEKRRIAPS